MARRIKEEPQVHQNRIAEAALKLFSRKGIDQTKMDEIAKEAGYGKATLYVYFQNKEDIVSYLALQSMEKLCNAIAGAINKGEDTKERFLSVCHALASFQEAYPSFFDRSLEYIQVVQADDDSPLSQAYKKGEELNQMIHRCLSEGVERGELEEIQNYFETIMEIWGMVSGLIKLSAEKAEYLETVGHISREEFLAKGFERIYKMLNHSK
ncbi:MAG: TetR/AcrR family transcriptional regulator [Lachnospiraceae bacterium]|nr:TetR/AcrR family transcriptional regulator [Lachnospiraceae bacterium]